MYGALGSQGASGFDAHLSIVQVAPAWHPMLHPPVGQLRIVHVAPAAHWMAQEPAAHVSITQVDPAAQCSMKHPTWQLPIVHVPPEPHSSMLHPPPVHAPRLQTVLLPPHFKEQPPGQVSTSQWLPSPQALI